MTTILGWLVIVIPVILGLAVVFMPEPAENTFLHRRWRWGLLVATFIYSGIVWWWQVRSDREASARSAAAIEQTSKRVADETTRSVTKAMGDEYQSIIAWLTSQIGDLRGQLAAQGRDVGAIKSSDIVSGKKPIKVVVTNATAAQQPSPPISGQPALPNISWTQESAPAGADGKR